MFKRIVQRIRDGKYAIKSWSLFGGWEYQDMKCPCCWWSLCDFHNSDCWTDDYDLILKLFDKEEEIVIKRK